MDQYIKQLISQQPRVIVPELGAFIATPEGGVMFNQYLNFDDGVLANAIAQQENISVDEANQRIKDYVSSAKQQLSSGNQVSIEGVGVVSNVDGRYEFAANGEAVAGTSAANAPIDLADNEIKAEETVKEETKIEEKPQAVTNTYVYEEEDNSRKRLIIIAIIVLLFLISVILCLFVINKDNCVYNFFFGGEKTEQVVKPVVKEPVAEPEPEVVEEVKPAKVDIATDKRYNIIVGTYKNEGAAQAKVEQLKAKGFDKAEVGTFRGDYVAIIDSYDRLPDAEARQEYIVDTYRIESYITNSGE
ncbi:MAG: hypothetical protein MJZ15_00185 [Bacteroidales bacterium]|nr:hypothetical protein [Bacteroidales bacterium]